MRLPLVSLGVLLLVPAVSYADMVTYRIDPSRSVLTLSDPSSDYGVMHQTVTGLFIGGGFGPPPPPFHDSLASAWGGTISVDRDKVANTFRIVGGTAIAEDSGSYAGRRGSDGTYEILDGNYGFIRPLTSSPGESATGAFRELQVALQSGLIQTPESFSTDGIVTELLSGWADYTIVGSSNTVPSFSRDIANQREAPGFAALSGGMGRLDGETLYIPVLMEFHLMGEKWPWTLRLQGTLVATASAIPEPGSLALLGVASAGLLMRRRAVRGAVAQPA